MPFPYGLNLVTVTGTFSDAAGGALTGSMIFTPVVIPPDGAAAQPVNVADASGRVVIGGRGVAVALQPPPSFRVTQYASPPVLPPQQVAVALIATDNGGLTPQNWCYQVSLTIGDEAPETFTALLPSSPSTVDFSQLVSSPAGTALYSYMPQTGGTMSGTLELGGSPPLQVPSGAGAGKVLTSDSSGNVSWGAVPVASVTAGDASVVVAGTAATPTIETGTLDEIATLHPAAANVSVNSHKVTNLSNGTAGTDAAAYGQTPAGGTTATIAQGGTGQTSQQLAINALAGAVTSGTYLRGNGTNVQMSTIQAADLPVLDGGSA